MNNDEKTKKVLVADLIASHERLQELQEQIISLSEKMTVTAYLLEGICIEYETFFELLAELKSYEINNIKQAFFIFHDTKKNKI